LVRSKTLPFQKKIHVIIRGPTDTSEEFICNHAVALSNLAIGYRLKVTVEHELLPKGLLIHTADGT